MTHSRVTKDDGTSTQSTTQVSPSVAAQATGKKDSSLIFFRILSYSTCLDRGLMIAAAICSVGTGATLPLMNLVFGQLVGSFNDYFTPGSNISQGDFHSSVRRNVLYIVYLFIGKLVLGYLSIYTFRMTGIRTSAAIRLAYMTALFNLPISEIDRLPVGAATGALTNVANAIQLAVSDKLGSLMQGIGMVVAAFAVAFKYSWSLTLVSSSVVFFVCIVSGSTAPLYFKYDKLVVESKSRASAIAGEILQRIRTVKALSAENQLLLRHSTWIDQARERGLKKSIWVAAQYWPLFFSNYANMALTFWFGVKLYMQNDIHSAGTIVTVLFCVLLVTVSIGQTAVPLQYISNASAAAGACFKIIDARQLMNNGLVDINSQELTDVRFDNVTFSYPSRPQTAVLQNLSFTIPRGKVTALVSQSGCGKSTIVALLERWYELSEVNVVLPKVESESEKGQRAEKSLGKNRTSQFNNQQPENPEIVLQNSGRITCSGYNIEAFGRKSWRSHIGLVQQEPVLFNETIYDNISKGLIGSKWEDEPALSKLELVREACREAFADEFIARLPNEYDAVVGEGGIKLSGGQRQRLAIARAIIKKPTILILDEATSSIDVRGERLVTAALKKISKGRTTVVIAHRLSTIKEADHIVVLKQGTAVEEGTHMELLERQHGIYAGLVSAQTLQLNPQVDGEEASDGIFHLSGDIPAALDGSVLEKQPEGHDHHQTSTQSGVLRPICSILYEQRHRYVFFAFILLAAMGAGATVPLQAYFFAHVVLVFRHTGTRLVSEANFWALMLFILALAVGVCYGIIGFSTNSLSTRVGACYRQRYLENIVHKPIAWFDEDGHSVGTLSGELGSDPQRFEELLGPSMAFPLIAAFSLLGCTAVSFAFGWKLALVVFFAALPVVVGAAFLRVRYDISFEEMNARVFAESSQFAAESIAAFRTVTALTLEETILRRYRQLLQGHVHAAFLKGRFSVLVFALSDSLDLCVVALAFWYGGQLLATREYGVLQFIVVYAAVVQGGLASGQFLALAPNVAQATGAANRIFASGENLELLSLDKSANAYDYARDQGFEVEFCDVGFTYPTRHIPVYKHLSFRIDRGEYVAFVGPSGCGKSTIISLLERFYMSGSGQILINGTDIRNLPLSQYRSLCGIVSQEPTLFEGTVRENLTLGLPSGSTSQDTIIEACQRAEIYTFISSLPQGLDTHLAGGTHASLSGGQKQRICIARALLRQPRILLLDEATNSLDSVSESLVQRAIEGVAAGRKTTVLVVAHRLATVQNADRIIVLGEGGVLLEEGTHMELLRRKGAYWSMCEAQALDR